MEEPDIRRCFWMIDEADTFNLRRNLMEYLQPFAANRVLVIRKSSGVTAGLFKTGGKATPDRVANKYEDYWYAARFLQQDLRNLVTAAYNHVGSHADQFSCERTRFLRSPASQVIIDPDVVALDPP